MAQMVEILPNGMVGSVYLTQSMLWLLMSCRHKEPGQQQPWYWLCSLICLGLSTRGVNFWWLIIIICWLWFYKGLTYCGSDKMAAILQTTFSTNISWMKMIVFCLRFHWSLFLWVQLKICQNYLIYWPTCESLGLNLLTLHLLIFFQEILRYIYTLYHLLSLGWCR